MKPDRLKNKIYFAQLPFTTELLIMETSAATTTDLIDDDVSWNTILHNFGFSSVAAKKFTEDYSTGRDLTVSNLTHIK